MENRVPGHELHVVGVSCYHEVGHPREAASQDVPSGMKTSAAGRLSFSMQRV